MKNLILKTVAITLSVVVVFVAVTYLVFALAFPKTLANAWDSLGNYNLSLKYYEKQYDKTDDISDLAIICDKVSADMDYNRAVKYLGEITSHADFEEYCALTDTANGYFYWGKYAISAYYKDGVNFAIEVATRATANEYGERNAFYVLIISLNDITESETQAIIAAITEIKQNLQDETQKGYAERDIALAQSLAVNG